MKQDIVFTREELELLQENPYELLSEELDNFRDDLLFTNQSNLNKVRATQEIDIIISEFAEKLRKIAKKYPRVGIGDTATDEAIVQNVYEAIH